MVLGLVNIIKMNKFNIEVRVNQTLGFDCIDHYTFDFNFYSKYKIFKQRFVNGLRFGILLRFHEK